MTRRGEQSAPQHAQRARAQNARGRTRARVSALTESVAERMRHELDNLHSAVYRVVERLEDAGAIDTVTGLSFGVAESRYRSIDRFRSTTTPRRDSILAGSASETFHGRCARRRSIVSSQPASVLPEAE